MKTKQIQINKLLRYLKKKEILKFNNLPLLVFTQNENALKHGNPSNFNFKLWICLCYSRNKLCVVAVNVVLSPANRIYTPNEHSDREDCALGGGRPFYLTSRSTWMTAVAGQGGQTPLNAEERGKLLYTYYICLS